MSKKQSLLHKWAVDFTESKRGHRSRDETSSPPGYSSRISDTEDVNDDDTDTDLVAKQGWSIALGPWKQLPINLLVLWTAGNSVSIFPIMMVGVMFFRPVQALLTLKDVYAKLKGDQAIVQMMVYLLANIVGIMLAVYKFHSMGVLPTHQSDWLEFMEPRKVLEISGGGILLN